MFRKRILIVAVILAGSSFLVGALAGRPALLRVTESLASMVEATPDVVDVPDLQGSGSQRARYVPAQVTSPLILDIHQWSQDHRGSFGHEYRGLIELARQEGWNYIRPELAGRNDGPDDCCSDLVLDRIESAYSYAVANGHVDTSRVFVVGASGGGYTGLCALMSGRFEVRGYNLWVPISDLVSWHRVQRNSDYGKDIRACTSSTGENFNVQEAISRSPLYMSTPPNIDRANVRIYAGIEDGWNGSVPITHSIDMFNRLATEAGHSMSVVDEMTAFKLLNLQGDGGDYEDLEEGRQIIFRREAGSIALTIFDGAHEGLSDQVMFDLKQLASEDVGPRDI